MVAAFRPYVAELEGLIATPASARERVAVHLDGEVARRLRTVVPLEELRRLGAFFTGETLARLIELAAAVLAWAQTADAKATGPLSRAASKAQRSTRD